jgi:hypothetical protein
MQMTLLFFRNNIIYWEINSKAAISFIYRKETANRERNYRNATNGSSMAKQWPAFDKTILQKIKWF